MDLRGIVSNPILRTEPRVVFRWIRQLSRSGRVGISHASNRRQKGHPISPARKNILVQFYRLA